MSSIKTFLYKVLMLFLTLLMSANWALRSFGFINQHIFRGRFRTATLFYLADQRYMESVTFPWYAKRNKWNPVLGGYFTFSGSGGFICVMGCNEREFTDPGNKAKLMAVYRRMEHIAQMLRVNTASYSGILPSVFAKMGIDREPIEAQRTVSWVIQAVKQVRETCMMPNDYPVVILGSQGHIGKRLTTHLLNQPDIELIQLDSSSVGIESERQKLADVGRPVLFLNAARENALDEYVNLLPHGSVVLNEVYPECSSATLKALKDRGVRYFHICGVAASSKPNFPRAYAGAVPCCAASAVGSLSGQSTATVVLRES